MKQNHIGAFLVIASGLGGNCTFAQDDTSATIDQAEVPASVDGSQMMDQQERPSHQEQPGPVENENERNQYRQSHRDKNQMRAREHGGTPDESLAHRSKGMRGQGREQSRNNRPAFKDFDTNVDGYLDEDEYARGHAERIAERAKEGRRMRNLGSTTFADLDSDGDGKVNANEFVAHQARQHQANQQWKQRN
ncbi:MAG: EF-hand domain-containing protein [Woeseiaceae bacterium]